MCLRCLIRSAGWVLGLCLVLAPPAGAASPAPGEYRLQPGDVIAISVAGLAQFGGQVAVQLDGTISVPVIGTLDVEGTPMRDVQNRIRSAFASRLLPVYGADGREVLRTVEREAVAATIVRYRPIWVAGDVARPGEQLFEPRMTVRQAIAAAGGLRSELTVDGMPRGGTVGLGEEYATAWLRAAALAVRAWQLRTELGEGGEFDPATLPPSPASAETLPGLLEIQTQIRDARLRDAAQEKAHLGRAAELTEQQIAVLSQQLEAEIKNEAEDQKEYERAQALLERGTLTSNRVVETRRLALFSATRKLQTTAQLAQARRQLEDYGRQLERLDMERRLAVLDELTKVEASLAEERVRMQTAEKQLRLAGMSVPRATDAGQEPQITIIRRTAEGSLAFDATRDDELTPGDVVEVSWQPRQPPSPLPAPSATGMPIPQDQANQGVRLSLTPETEPK